MSIQWSLVLFTAISGCGAWLFVCTALGELRGEISRMQLPASIAAVVLMVVGGLLSATHLSHVDRIFAVLTHPAPGIFLEALLLGIMALTVIVFAMLVKRENAGRSRKVLAAIGLVLGVVFVVSCGASYMMDARPAWSTPLLPLAYAGTSAAAGAGMYLALASLCKEGEGACRNAGLYTVAGGVLSLVTAMSYGMLSGIATGSEALLFWVGAVLVGGIAPLAAGIVAWKKPSGAFALGIVALVGGFVGSVTVRALMWLVGAAILNYFGVTL